MWHSLTPLTLLHCMTMLMAYLRVSKEKSFKAGRRIKDHLQGDFKKINGPAIVLPPIFLTLALFSFVNREKVINDYIWERSRRESQRSKQVLCQWEASYFKCGKEPNKSFCIHTFCFWIQNSSETCIRLFVFFLFQFECIFFTCSFFCFIPLLSPPPLINLKTRLILLRSWLFS